MNLLLSHILKIINSNRYFFIPYFVFISIGPFLLIAYDKNEILLWLNSQHNPFLDVFFSYATWLGDGIFVAVLLLPFAIFKIKYAIDILIIYLFTGAITQLLKMSFGFPRPIAVLTDTFDLHVVEGVAIYSNNSFPSGHTATAFALFLFLSYISPKKWMGTVFFSFALVVALSRIYLLQHFYVDVYVGSLIGGTFTIFTIIILENYKKLHGATWYNKPLLHIFKAPATGNPNNY